MKNNFKSKHYKRALREVAHKYFPLCKLSFDEYVRFYARGFEKGFPKLRETKDRLRARRTLRRVNREYLRQLEDDKLLTKYFGKLR